MTTPTSPLPVPTPATTPATTPAPAPTGPEIIANLEAAVAREVEAISKVAPARADSQAAEDAATSYFNEKKLQREAAAQSLSAAAPAPATATPPVAAAAPAPVATAPSIWERVYHASQTVGGWVLSFLSWFWGFFTKLVIPVLVLVVLVWAFLALNKILYPDQAIATDSGIAVSTGSKVLPTPEPTVALQPTAVPEEQAVVVQPNDVPVVPTAEKAPAKPVPTKASAKPAPPPAAKPAAGWWNSGDVDPVHGTADFQPKVGMICHGDKIGPFGSADGTHPVVVQFWTAPDHALSIVWGSCEWNTGRDAEAVKKDVDDKYKKSFEIVNN